MSKQFRIDHGAHKLCIWWTKFCDSFVTSSSKTKTRAKRRRDFLLRTMLSARILGLIVSPQSSNGGCFPVNLAQLPPPPVNMFGVSSRVLLFAETMVLHRVRQQIQHDNKQLAQEIGLVPLGMESRYAGEHEISNGEEYLWR